MVDLFKNAVNSAKDKLNEIKNQVVEELKEENHINKNNTISKNIIKEKQTGTETEDVKIINNEQNKENSSMYCSNCGKKISSNSKFCNFCGIPIDNAKNENINKDNENEKKEIGTKSEELTERETVYEGKIHKCPNCGEVLKSFVINCPVCGCEIRDSKNSSAVEELAFKLENIESRREQTKGKNKIFGTLNLEEPLTRTDEQKISLIRSFPIPNTKEDLYEFLILSKSNIEIDLYENTQIKSARLAVSDAWKAKFEQSYQKAKLLFKNDERMFEIQVMYDETNKSINNAKWKTWKIVGVCYGVIFGMIAVGLIISAIATNGFKSNEVTSNNENTSMVDKQEEITYSNTEEETLETNKNSSTSSVSFGDNIVANSNEYIKIKEVGYTMTGNYLTCIVTITNSNSKKAIEYPSFRVTAYNKEGNILGSEERVLNVLYPNQDMVDQGTLIEISEEPEKIEVTMLEPDSDDVVDVSSLEHPVYKEIKCQNLSVNADKITGEAYNPNDYKIESAMIIVVFRDSNNRIVASESEFVDNIPADGKIPFDISLASDVTITDKIEAFAYIW